MKEFKKKILQLLSENEQLEISDLQTLLYVTGESEQEDFQKDLDYLMNKGLIRKNRTTLALSLKEDYVLGTFRGSEKGFGFLIPFAKAKDYYVYHKNLRGALDGDVVVGKITRHSKGDKLAEVTIMEIVVDGKEKYLGTFHDNGGNGYVFLDNPRIPEPIFVSQKRRNGAEEDQKVYISITMRGKKEKGPSGEILEILGHKNDKGLDILTIAREKDIDVDFSPEALQEAESISEVIPADELKKRLDLRNELVITIDGADSKDLDDAISIKKLDNGNYELGVHIADVAHFVKEGSPLDVDAVQRATSVYLVDRVIPMLPKKLSNGVCSLHPNVDRLTLSCIMEVNAQGKVLNQKVAETVINSNKRMTYDDVKKIVAEQNEELIQEHQDIYPMLLVMEELARILMKKRENRGAIDFDFAESKIVLDEDNRPVDIKKYERNIATRMIEEFMILANETVSEVFTKKELPFVYRIHETPDPEKIARFKNFIQLFGFGMLGDASASKEMQDLLEQIKGQRGEFAIQHMMLRSLKKAKYSPNNVGHYGLASEFYSHFTSPIRRYPDLQIHRIIKEYLNGTLGAKRKELLEKIVKQNSEQSSKQELKAAEAERDSVQLKKAEYMKERIGEEYEGIVTGVTEYGLYVQLDNTVEGLVHISKLKDDYYLFDEETLSLVGERTLRRFTLGDSLKIKVLSVNISRKEIDFVIIEEAKEIEAEVEKEL